LNVGSHHHEAKNIQDETMTVWRWIINEISIQNEGETFIYRRGLLEIQNIFIVLKTLSFYSINFQSLRPTLIELIRRCWTFSICFYSIIFVSTKFLRKRDERLDESFEGTADKF
jgi:hypothetical protein